MAGNIPAMSQTTGGSCCSTRRMGSRSDALVRGEGEVRLGLTLCRNRHVGFLLAQYRMPRIDFVRTRRNVTDAVGSVLADDRVVRIVDRLEVHLHIVVLVALHEKCAFFLTEDHWLLYRLPFLAQGQVEDRGSTRASHLIAVRI